MGRRKKKKTSIPLEGVEHYPQTKMPPHPAAGATDFAKFAPPMHGCHEKPACELGELGSLWSVRRDCFSHKMSA